MKAIGIGIGILGAALIGAAGLAVFAFIGTGGWIVAGVAALGAVLMVVPWKSMWDGLVGGIKSFGDALTGLWAKIKGMLGGDAGVPNIASPMNYDGNGNGLLHRISYGSGNGFGSSSSTGGGASRGFGGSSSTGGGAGNGGIGSVPANITGNAFIQALRSPFARELQDPNTRLQVMGMMLAEGGGSGPMPLADVKSLMNRASFAHKTLLQMLHGGFYGPIKKGMLPKFMAEVRRNPALMARLNAYIDQALAGSNLIEGHTDQGSLALGDPGAAWENARLVRG